MSRGRICTIIPFIEEVLPWQIPPNSLLIQDGGTKVPKDKLLEGHNVNPTAVGTAYSAENLGFPRIMNQAVDIAYKMGYKYVVCWNSDAAFLDLGCPELLADYLDANPKCAAVGPGCRYRLQDGPIGS